MGVDVMEVRVHVRKTLIFVMRTCYRSACDHPFVVGIGFFFFYLYRYFPGLFAFLVSSSPVIICTAVLLGALLSFGEPNIPEIEEEEEVDDEKTRETHHEVSALKTGGVVEGDLVVEKDGNFSVETHVENNENVVVDEKDSGFSAEISDRSFAVEEDRNGDHHERGLYEKREITEDERELYEKREITEDERELYESSLYEKREITEDEWELYEKSLYEKTPLTGEDGGKKEIEGVHVENLRPESELPGTYLEDPFGASSWKQIKDQDESSDSESDGGESSSPDASMADILPMLDELHPLLDTEVPQPALASPGESDDALESSSGSDDESSEENEEVENWVEEEDNDDEEEDQQGRKDDGTKPVVTWTEDDEKNLMDLGNSELERNRRLESLIARRRARKSMRAMVIEKNLIDVNGPPFQIAPISTARRNPFDLHYDSNEGLGLPPIPGSAPSVMAPRRNPFDLPYGPSEERPNLSGGSFEEEFLTGHDKDMYFRRHESFNMGSSYLGESSKHDFQFRPYFTTEQASPDRMDYHSFHRQLSDISYSKISSVSDTESVSSTVENDSQMNVIEPELSQEGEMIHHTDHVSHHDKPESLSSTVLDNQRNLVEQELSQDGELLDHDDHSRPHDKPESPSSLEVVIGDRDQGDSDADDEIYPERDFILPDTESMTNAYMKPEEVLEERHSGSSSSSSMDSGDENRFEEQTRDKTSKDCDNSVQPSTVDSDVRDSIEEVDDSKTKEPVYDCSLLEIEKSISGMLIMEESLSFKNKEVHTSTSSVAFDMHVDGKSSMHDGDTEKVTTANNEGQWVASLELCTVEENEMHSKEVAMISEEDVMKVGFSGDDQKSDKHIASTLSSVDEPASSDSVSSSSEAESEDERELTEVHHEQDQIPTSSSLLVHAGSPRFDIEESDSKISDSGVSFEDLVHLESEQPLPFHSDHEEIQEPSSYLVLSTNGTNAVDLVEEIKEIDERLLTELDAVGDFSVEESRASTEEIEEQLATEVQQSLPQLQVLEANSTEGVKYDSQILVKPEALLEPQHPLESWAICSDFELGKGSSELQGLDANSNEDVDQTFNQLEKVESSIDERDEPEPKETEGGNAQFHLLNDDPIPMKTILELPVAETRSLDIIDFTFEKLHEGESESRIAIEPEHHERILEETHESNKVNLHSEVPILIETKSELQVLEARSLQDIDSVFKQFHQDEVEKLTPLESTQDESTLEETEVRFTDLEIPNQDQNPIETNLELPVLEARSLEDIEAALKNFHGEEIQMPKVESIHKESIFEETQAGSSKFEVPSQYTESAFTHSHEEEEIQKPAVLESISKESAFEETQAGFEVPSQDIELPLKHFHEEEIQKPIVLEPIHEESMFEEIQARFSKSEVTSQDLQPTEVNLGLPFLEARLVEDTGSSLNQLQEEEAIKPVFESVTDKSALEETTAEIAEFELSNRDAKPTETSSELPVSEARSLDDIGSAFEQVHEEVTESVVLESVHDMSKLEETRVDPAESNIQNEDQDASETVLVQPDIREEDNGVAPEQLNKGEAEKPSVLEPVEAVLKGAEVRSDENSPSVVYAGLSDSGLGHPAQEVRYLEHIDSGSQQLQKGHQEKPAHDESVEEGQGMSTLHGSVKEDYHEITVPRESSEPQVALQTDTGSQVHEAASIGDVHLSPKQLPEDEIEGLLKPTESEDGSSELLMKETELTSGIRADNEDSTAQEISTSIESEWLITEANEAPSSITTDMNKEKKKGSGKSSSSSSSSSRWRSTII